MTEIIKDDYIILNNMKNITSITNFNNQLFISALNSSNNVSSYEIVQSSESDESFNLTNYKTYNLIISNILSICSNNSNTKLLIIKQDDFNIYSYNIISNIVLKLKVHIGSEYYDLKDFILNTIYNFNKKKSCIDICFDLLSLIVINTTIYYFVKTNCNHNKGQKLYIICGNLHNDNEHINNIFDVKMCIKINKLSKKHLLFKNATYDTRNNNLILLFTYGKDNINGI